MAQQYARLTDSQWDQFKSFLPIQRKHDLRDVFNAILWITRTGCQWRNLDRQFPPWQVVHYYFSKWSRDHTLETMNDALNRQERELVFARESTPSLLLVDAQSVRLLPRIGCERGIDGGKWVNGRKRSILTDTLGRLGRVEVHAANVHDGITGLDLIYPSNSHYRSDEPDAVQVDELIVQGVHGLDGHDPEDRTGGVPQLDPRFEFSEQGAKLAVGGLL